MDLEEALKIFYESVEMYHKSEIDDINTINMAMKNISVALVYMTKERVEFNKKWEAIVFEKSKKMSNVAAKTIANNDVPELYKIRKVQETGQNLLKSIISHYSRLKNEK